MAKCWYSPENVHKSVTDAKIHTDPETKSTERTEKTEWKHIVKLPYKVLAFCDAIAYMWFSGGIGFRLLVLVGIALIGSAAIIGVPVAGIMLLTAIMLLCVGLEVGNTVLEILLDVFRPYFDIHVKHLKDLSSALPILATVVDIVVWAYLVFG